MICVIAYLLIGFLIAGFCFDYLKDKIEYGDFWYLILLWPLFLAFCAGAKIAKILDANKLN